MYQNRRKEERNQSKRTNENRRKVNFVSEQVNENEKKNGGQTICVLIFPHIFIGEVFHLLLSEAYITGYTERLSWTEMLQSHLHIVL